MRKVVMALGALMLTAALAAPALFAGDAKLASGIPAGGRVGPFDVVDVSGPNKGNELCYVCQYSGAPTVMAFVNGAELAKSGGLLTHMQKMVTQNAGLKAFVVVVGGPETKPMIEGIAAKHHLSIPITFLPRGKADAALAQYKINPDARVTVMVNRQNRVLANFVNVGPDQFPAISAAAKKMLAEG